MINEDEHRNYISALIHARHRNDNTEALNEFLTGLDRADLEDLAWNLTHAMAAALPASTEELEAHVLNPNHHDDG